MQRPLAMAANEPCGPKWLASVSSAACVAARLSAVWLPTPSVSSFSGQPKFVRLREDIEAAPDGSVFLLHACAHNPTGVDPTREQWAEVSAKILAKGHHVLMDCAYQGFASGDAEADASAIRRFLDDGHSLLLAQSFAKNFGLYGERVGTLSVACADAAEKERVMSQLKLIIRPMYSTPPASGARIVSTILQDDVLNPQWYAECKGMADRIIGARATLKQHLVDGGATRNWDHVTNQIGMFAYTGLTKDQCARMISDHHIYLTSDGRVSMAGVTEANAPYIANAILDVTEKS